MSSAIPVQDSGRVHAVRGERSLEELSAGFERALTLLSGRRYSELVACLESLESRASELCDSDGLVRMRAALTAGSLSERAVRESFDRVERRMLLLSGVAQQVVQLELGMMRLVEMPAEGAYDRDGVRGRCVSALVQREA